MEKIDLSQLLQVKKEGDKIYSYNSKDSIVAGLPLGYIYTWPFSTPPEGSIIANGSEYSRELYSDLWNYISSHSDWIKTEEEWQNIASSSNGYCPYYSSGDGTTTFRTPKFAPFQQLAISSSNAGLYHEAGLPNISGWTAIGGWQGIYATPLGPFKVQIEQAGRGLQVTEDASNNLSSSLFDASLSSNKYGKSDTVQPESSEWIVCIVAYGKVTNVGNTDVANVMSAIDTTQSLVNEREKVNSSGDGWVRYESGLQLCYSAITINSNGYINFPVPFSSKPEIFTTPIGNATSGYYIVVYNKDKSSGSSVYVQTMGLNGSINLAFSYLAIGMWK